MSKRKEKSVLEPAPEEKARVVLRGDLTIRKIAETHAQILEAMTKPGMIEIEFADVTATDLSMFQLLCSTHRSAALRSENGIKFTGALPDSLLRMGTEAGPCRECAQRKLSCYWEVA